MDFKNFFSQFNTPESYALLILWALAFLLGILIGSLLRGGAIRRLKRELEVKQAALDAAQVEVTRLTDELNLREADLRKAQFEAEEQRSKVTRLADEKTKLYNEVYGLNTEIEKLQNAPKVDNSATVIDLQTTLDRQNEQITALQTRNQELENELAQLRNNPPLATPAPEPATETIETVDYLAEFQSTQNALRARLEALEGKIGNLETENTTLRTSIEALKTTDIIAPPAEMEIANIPVISTTQPEPVWNLGARQVPMPPPMETPTVEGDDLTRIDGIGPFLAKQLNDANIYTYEQISQWNTGDMNAVTEQIRYFPGRIERENWVGQAAQLIQEKSQPVASYNATNAIYPADHTDLKVIEGIGPKIETLLRDARIHTWDDLAETDLDRLDAILEAAGDDFTMHNPATWTAQARLAAGGHWELLKEYQEQLKSGGDR